MQLQLIQEREHVLYMYCTDITYNVYTNDAENIGTQRYYGFNNIVHGVVHICTCTCT